MRIAIVVQGRFHAFDLAKGLLRRGHDVTVFTNYPKWAVKRFRLPADRVCSFWIHGIASKVVHRLIGRSTLMCERWLHPVFGRWAARRLRHGNWDVIHSWSGVSEEILLTSRGRMNFIMRGSAHIRVQDSLLQEEEQRTGRRLERPGEWLQRREEREYSLVDRIVVLSSFAYKTFTARGVASSKLRLVPLGVDTSTFRPTAEAVEARCRRILSGAPLQVVCVGAVSFRKGLWDLAAIARRLETDNVRLRLIGPVTREAREIVSGLANIIELVPKQRQSALPAWYTQADLFLFPTLEDGFAVVLAQARANALPILATTNCAGPDLIQEGQSGWILPIRSSDAFVDRLRWCDTNRQALSEMVRNLHRSHKMRTWDDVAGDFEAICMEQLELVRLKDAVNG